MTAKQLEFGEQARERLPAGVTGLADAARLIGAGPAGH
jgi:hypothetical protein